MSDSDSAMFDNMHGATQSVDTITVATTHPIDAETVIGIQRMREEIKESSHECDVYKKALEDILNAHTVGKMIEIADRVLKENRK